MSGEYTPLPVDKNGNDIQGGITPYVHEVAMDGTNYVAITIPTGYECKGALLKMQDGTEFNFSHTNVATVPYIPITSLSIDIVAKAGDIIGYAKGTNAQNLAVLLLG